MGDVSDVSRDATESEYSASEDEEAPVSVLESPLVLSHNRRGVPLGAARGRKNVRIPTDPVILKRFIKQLSQRLHGEVVEGSLSLRVLKAAFTMQLQYQEKLTRQGEQKKPPPPQIRQKIAAMLGLSSVTFGSIMRDFLLGNRIYSSHRTGNC